MKLVSSEIVREVSAFQAVGKLNWDDIELIAATTEKILRDLADDKPLFKRLLLSVPNREELWSKCEEGVVEDKIVLWDDPANNFRIRLRLATSSQEEMPHQHRFSFTQLILRGTATHRIYSVSGDFGPDTSLGDITTICVREDRPGDCFTIHHSAVHSTPLSSPGTTSLVLRGPAVKDRAPVMFREDRGINVSEVTADTVEPAAARAGHFFWRIGEQDETPERRAQKRMRPETFESWISKLEGWKII